MLFYTNLLPGICLLNGSCVASVDVDVAVLGIGLELTLQLRVVLANGKRQSTDCQIAANANEPQNAKTKFFNSLENELAEIIIKEEKREKEKQSRGKKRIARHSAPKHCNNKVGKNDLSQKQQCCTFTFDVGSFGHAHELLWQAERSIGQATVAGAAAVAATDSGHTTDHLKRLLAI